MHPDHSAGLTDMSNGELLFPNAELVMHENEPAHWFDDGALAKADERSAKLFFQAGREQVAPYKKRTRLFRQGEVFPGVTAIPSHRAYAGPHRLSRRIRQRAVDDLGRHRACAGSADRVSRSRHGLRHRSRRGRGFAQADVRPRLRRRRAGRRECICISRPSRGSRGAATPMRFTRKPGFTRSS